MKRIVTGIDFSNTSVLAFRYAAQLAEKTDSGLLLVNVQKHLDYEVPQKAEVPKGPEPVMEQFEDLVARHRGDFRGPVEFTVKQGKVHEEIANLARYADAWLVVVGAHGLSGFEEFWMGSRGYRVVSTCLTPVITVRQGFPVERPVKTVVIPIDNTLETGQKVPFTLDLARHFDAGVHVLSLFSDDIHAVKEKVKNSAREAHRLVREAGLRLVTHEEVCENITTATIEYARRVDADLISIMTEQEYAARNVYLGPYAQQMVNHAPIPVLSMHGKALVRSRGVF
jgi:nucleotide-binding universal stress UspA family protein